MTEITVTIGASEVQIKACPGDLLTFECRVYGSLQSSTVWKGPTFSECNNNEVILFHHRFWENNGTISTCNREASISTRVEGNSLYISYITLVVQPEMTDIVIECLLDDNDPHDGDEPTNISLISTSSSWCNTSRNVNDTTTSPGADHTVNLHIIIPGSIIALFILLLFTSLLLYGIHKKIWSIST